MGEHVRDWKPVRKKTMERFKRWRADEANLAAFFQLVWDGMNFRDACVAMDVPYRLMYPFVHDIPENRSAYDGMLKAKAHDYVMEMVPLADSLEGVESKVAVAAIKVRIEARQHAAAALDRERFGEKMGTGPATTPVVIQIANLRGDTKVAISAPQETPAVLAPGEPA